MKKYTVSGHIFESCQMHHLKFIITIILISLTLHADMKDYKITPETKIDKNIHIKILDAKQLDFADVHELSALAYVNQELYALSDKGVLYLFNCIIKDDKIQRIALREHYILKNKKLHEFKKKKSDSEGLAFYKKGFLISFERKNRVLYCSRKGVKIKNMPLNNTLKDNNNYQSPNKGLESVSFSKIYGLITIPELPLKNKNSNYHRLYGEHQVWKFQAKGAVTDIEFIDNTHLLVLLREYNYLNNRHITSLVEVNLEQCNTERVCQNRVLARLDSARGWHIDNFEGLTKVGKNRFLMVSDDNDSIFQKTLLVLFEIKS